MPADAPENCPGTKSDQAGKSSACDGCPNQKICASGEAKQVDPDLAAIGKRPPILTDTLASVVLSALTVHFVQLKLD